jgi:hypothetical protein
MYACMLYQTTLVTECFITHVTSIRALTTMHVCMPYQTTLEHKAAHYYVNADVLSNGSVD